MSAKWKIYKEIRAEEKRRIHNYHIAKSLRRRRQSEILNYRGTNFQYSRLFQGFRFWELQFDTGVFPLMVRDDSMDFKELFDQDKIISLALTNLRTLTIQVRSPVEK